MDIDRASIGLGAGLTAAKAERSRPFVKTCGLGEAATIDVALARGADEIGFVHFPPSPRHLSLDAIEDLVAHVGPRGASAIVLVDPDDALLDAIATRIRPVTLQLHGRESAERVAAIRARTGLPVMKAIGVSGEGVGAAVSPYLPVADRILLDARAPKGAALPGGNGIAFDWTILAGAPELRAVPFLLSGGLNAGNVAQAVRIARPFGLDVSSGIESAPGVKSAALIHRFFDALDAATSSSAERPRP